MICVQGVRAERHTLYQEASAAGGNSCLLQPAEVVLSVCCCGAFVNNNGRTCDPELFHYLFTIALADLLKAYAAQGHQSEVIEIWMGVIEQITSVDLPSSHHASVGEIKGFGGLVDVGTERGVSMALDTLGGAFASNEIQKKHDQPIPGQEFIVHLSSGGAGFCKTTRNAITVQRTKRLRRREMTHLLSTKSVVGSAMQTCHALKGG